MAGTRCSFFQFVAGFFSFLLLLCCESATASFRASLVPIHATFGIATFVLAIATACAGLTEKAFFSLRYELILKASPLACMTASDRSMLQRRLIGLEPIIVFFPCSFFWFHHQNHPDSSFLQPFRHIRMVLFTFDLSAPFLSPPTFPPPINNNTTINSNNNHLNNNNSSAYAKWVPYLTDRSFKAETALASSQLGPEYTHDMMEESLVVNVFGAVLILLAVVMPLIISTRKFRYRPQRVVTVTHDRYG